MPNWYAESDDGSVRCYFGDPNGHDLDRCAVVHEVLFKKWEYQRNMRPLPDWLQEVADSRTWSLDEQQSYYTYSSEDEDYDYVLWDEAVGG